MAIDFNDAERQQSGDFTPIPEGTVAPVRLSLREIKKSKTGATGLDVEYVVTAGPFAKRKVWAWHGIAGNDSEGHDKMVSITRAFVRAALESASGVDPTDASAEAMSARSINEWEDLDGLEFLARFKVEEAKEYTDQRSGEVRPGKAKNTLQAVTPDDDEYAGFKPVRRVKSSGGAGKPTNGTTGANRPAWA